MPVEPTRYTVPGWGTGELWLRGNVLLAHEFLYALSPKACPPKGADAPPSDTLVGDPSRVGNDSVPTSRRGAPDDPSISPGALVERFRSYFAGRAMSFDDVQLDLSWATAFQRELTSALRAIPRGEVVTYGELAALAGRPGAARAAGTFCATNRFAIVVPCHRVVAANGIGGYGPNGVPVKRRLLALEGVCL